MHSVNNNVVDLLDLTLHHQELTDDELEEIYEGSHNDVVEDDNAGEGSSTATLRIRKVGKKKGEKLRRKEQMRQYREYMDHQRDARRAQDEILDEEYRRQKAEEAIQRADEMEKRRKRQEKLARQEEKARLNQLKQQEKEMTRAQQRFQKYHTKIKTWVKDTKVCHVDELAKHVGLTVEDTVAILQQLCDTDPDFDLALWSNDRSTLMYVVPSDYDRLAKYMDQHHGKLVVNEVLGDPFLILDRQLDL
ncbi:hypothetical protein BC941DRAFT_451578 [Chlamydoabsidia padenii]|nr:hypothetical protein BC941DRAFT_451578 [Chlamydoabsidia padenii]